MLQAAYATWKKIKFKDKELPHMLMFVTRILKRGAKPTFEPMRELATFSPFSYAFSLKI